MDWSSIDLFGVAIGLRYLNKEQFHTTFGTVISLIIGFSIILQTIIVGKELFVKENPEVISAERFVASPARFDLKKDTFNFAFGAQFPGNYSQFLDETIYTVSAQQITMKKVYNKETQSYEQLWDYAPVLVRPCNIKQFEVPETIKYFSNLVGFNEMYCLDQEAVPLFLEGNFDQDSFATIQITMKMCSGLPSCRDPSEIKQILTNSFVAFNSNDVIVNSKNFDPFSVVGRDFFWNASPVFAKDVTLYFRNTYVESDQGVFFEDKTYQRRTAHSVQGEQIIFDESDYYFQFFLRFEKAKESVFHRTYKKLDSVLAEIGGIAKALLMIGFLISIPINRLKFSQQLSSQLFNYRQNDKLTISTLEIEDNHGKSYGNCSEFRRSIFDTQQAASMDTQRQQPNTHRNLICQQPQCQNNCNNNSKFPDKPYQFQMSKDNLSFNKLKDQKQSQLLVNEKQSILKVPTLKISQFNEFKKTNILTQEENQLKDHFNCIQQQQQPETLQQQATLQQTVDNNKYEPFQITSQQFVHNLTKFQDIQNQMKSSSFSVKGGNLQQFKMTESADITNFLNQSCHDIQRHTKQPLKSLPYHDINALNLKWYDYIKYYFWPFGGFRKKKELIQFSAEKVYQHLDMVYIIKKLLELEKIKQILLTQDQIDLIQFLPKPCINVDTFKDQMVASRKRRGSKKLPQISLLTNTQQIEEKEKAKAAFMALRNILKKNQLSIIDQRIIEMLESSTIEKIENNMEYLAHFEMEEKTNKIFDDVDHPTKGQELKDPRTIPTEEEGGDGDGETIVEIMDYEDDKKDAPSAKQFTLQETQPNQIEKIDNSNKIESLHLGNQDIFRGNGQEEEGQKQQKEVEKILENTTNLSKKQEQNE